MKCDCANCPTHACYTKGVNCTGVLLEAVKEAYTEEELKYCINSAYDKTLKARSTAISAVCRKLRNLPKLWATKSWACPSASV